MSYRLTETLATFNAGAVTEVHHFDTWDEAMEHVSERASAMTEEEREEYFYTLRLEGAEYELDYEPDEVDLEQIRINEDMARHLNGLDDERGDLY